MAGIIENYHVLIYGSADGYQTNRAQILVRKKPPSKPGYGLTTLACFINPITSITHYPNAPNIDRIFISKNIRTFLNIVEGYFVKVRAFPGTSSEPANENN